ncbi:MAG: glutaredoxin domain-containing protein, partial [Victivallaceae bacterium]|nr:glutaredoxin domain-containing protein [Victivallaceae bacterium]
TCPNCRTAKQFLDKAGIDYQVILADQDPEAARKYDINHAPTLVVTDGSGMEKFENVSNIRHYIENR